MDIHLREGEVDAMLRELLVNLLVDSIEHVPIVGDFGPCTHDERHLAIVQTLDIHAWRVIGFRYQGG